MPTRPSIEGRDGRVVVRVRVQPRASRNAIHLEPKGAIRVALTAPPVDGAANAALLAFVAKTLGVSKRSVALTRGERSREKTLEVEGLTVSAVRERLLRHDAAKKEGESCPN